jgi:hypothetical protein
MNQTTHRQGPKRARIDPQFAIFVTIPSPQQTPRKSHALLTVRNQFLFATSTKNPAPPLTGADCLECIMH